LFTKRGKKEIPLKRQTGPKGLGKLQSLMQVELPESRPTVQCLKKKKNKGKQDAGNNQRDPERVQRVKRAKKVDPFDHKK